MNLKPGKYLRSEANGHIYIHDAATAAIPHMRVVFIGEDGKVVGDDEMVDVDTSPAVAVDEPDLRREDLVALYVKKHGRKPHPRMRIERLKQMVEGANGHDSSPVDH